MELEGIIAFVSLAVSGVMIIYKLVNKVKKSNCVVIDKDGEKYQINFDDLKKSVEDAEKVYNKELTEEERKKLREILNKSLENITSPKVNKNKKNLTLDI